MKVRRLVSAAAFAVLLCTSAPTVFAGESQPWDGPPPNSLVGDLLNAAVAGVQAALTVL